MKQSGNLLGPALLALVPLLATQCQEATSPTSMSEPLEALAAATADGTIGVANTVTVFTSGSHVTAWDPILVTNQGSNWPSTICVDQPQIGLDANWVNPHPAYTFNVDHPFEIWYPSWNWDATWINAYTNGPAPGWQSKGLDNAGHNWTKYSTPVSGNGDFVVQFLADNCSWIYLDDELIGVQKADFNQNSSGRYALTLDGEHELSFIIFDGGGAAGGKFRLETTQSYIDNGGDPDVVDDPITPQNVAPVADAGTDATFEATGATMSVALNGSASSDADGDELTYTWTQNGFTVATGATSAVTLGLGEHTFTLTVTDEAGATDTDEVTVRIEDTTAPAIAFTVVTTQLWPPNHRMVLVGRNIGSSDVVDGSPNLTITVASSEAANGIGDGNTESDYQIVDNGNGTYDVYVRAERSGANSGRTYTITMTATDASGNDATRSFTASVNHDQGRKAR